MLLSMLLSGSSVYAPDNIAIFLALCNQDRKLEVTMAVFQS